MFLPPTAAPEVTHRKMFWGNENSETWKCVSWCPELQITTRHMFTLGVLHLAEFGVVVLKEEKVSSRGFIKNYKGTIQKVNVMIILSWIILSKNIISIIIKICLKALNMATKVLFLSLTVLQEFKNIERVVCRSRRPGGITTQSRIKDFSTKSWYSWCRGGFKCNKPNKQPGNSSLESDWTSQWQWGS